VPLKAKWLYSNELIHAGVALIATGGAVTGGGKYQRGVFNFFC
jgi:hypothetical protein